MGNSYTNKVTEEMYKRHLNQLHTAESQKITSTKLLNKTIIHKFKKNNCKMILEAGCGEGRFLEQARSEGLEAGGFDKNSELVKLCKRKNLAVIISDVEKKLPYKANSFDGLYCANVLEHTQDPGFSIYEFHRLLRKGGLLIVAVPEYSRYFYDDWTHKRPFTKITLQKLAGSAGFRRFRVYKRHFPFLVKYWDNPFVRVINIIGSKGIFAFFITMIIEGLFKFHRHDLVLEGIK